MSIMKFPPMEEKKGFLDTNEKVHEAWCSLEKATEKDYKKYDEAKRAVQEISQTKLLD
ncbi:MAG: hypothetical protein ACE5KZ_01110 [Candidatus Scalinduaceae bacterium]